MRNAAYALIGIMLVAFIAAAYLSSRLSVTHPRTMLSITAPAFSQNGGIPPTYTCDGDNTNPELRLSGVPDGAKSLALIVDDPDIPQTVKDRMGIEVFDHWVVFNIPPETKELSEGMRPAGTEGNNGAGKAAYTGPCPPDREHRYLFTLYALDTTLDLPEGASRADVEKAMEGHVLETAVLTGRYERTGR
jgi:Raf kinase inhibitor-like YbhB/YbcL family protein